jgi:hypothetical protein
MVRRSDIHKSRRVRNRVPALHYQGPQSSGQAGNESYKKEAPYYLRRTQLCWAGGSSKPWQQLTGYGKKVTMPAPGSRRPCGEHNQQIICSVAGVIFLGTPHRGLAFSFWANVKMTVGSLMGQPTFAELVKVLNANSEPLAAGL